MKIKVKNIVFLSFFIGIITLFSFESGSISSLQVKKDSLKKLSPTEVPSSSEKIKISSENKLSLFSFEIESELELEDEVTKKNTQRILFKTTDFFNFLKVNKNFKFNLRICKTPLYLLYKHLKLYC